jgi:hypothetical protein
MTIFNNTRCLAILVGLSVVLAAAAAADERPVERQEQNPLTTSQPPPSVGGGVPPSVILDELKRRPVPALMGTGEVAKKNTSAFIDWASSSTSNDTELVRKALAEAHENSDVVNTMCEEAFASQTSENTRALVALSLLGEI